MLPQKLKVKRRVFASVASKGRVHHAPYFTLRVLKKVPCDSQNSTFSFVVSRKVSAKATKRNLLKRRSYAVIRKELNNIKPCFACVFFLKKESLGLSYQGLEKEIVSLLKKAKVL